MVFHHHDKLDKISGMNPMKKRVLLFDIDGTLLDHQGQGQRLIRRAVQQVFGVNDLIDEYDMSGKTDWQIVMDLMQLAGLATETIEASRGTVFSVYAQLMQHAGAAGYVQVLPGVIPLLDRLKMESVFELGLLTGNVREVVPPNSAPQGSTR